MKSKSHAGAKRRKVIASESEPNPPANKSAHAVATIEDFDRERLGIAAKE